MSTDKVDTLDIVDILFVIRRCLPIASYSIFPLQLVYKNLISGEFFFPFTLWISRKIHTKLLENILRGLGVFKHTNVAVK